ncbi:MAG: GNAT family N-acetyltransferase [Lachnospiraceae bacterium]|nr:GNAT family N-acetyltransferase [Lachnospiraceae bacterium]
MEIVKLSFDTLKDMNKANEAFEIIGKLKPTFVNDEWTCTEELYACPHLHSYPDEDGDYSLYIDNPDKAVFLAYFENECVGQIVLRKDWNKYAFVEDICVSKSSRGQGVGTALIQKAIEWAKDKELYGLALETQDNNLLACRFYLKCGFIIGAVNTMLYKNFPKPWSDATAIFWYLKFK